MKLFTFMADFDIFNLSTKYEFNNEFAKDHPEKKGWSFLNFHFGKKLRINMGCEAYARPCQLFSNTGGDT